MIYGPRDRTPYTHGYPPCVFYQTTKSVFMGKGPPPSLPINILLGSGYAFDAYIHQGRGCRGDKITPILSFFFSGVGLTPEPLTSESI